MRIGWQLTMHTEVKEQGMDQTSLCYNTHSVSAVLLVSSSGGTRGTSLAPDQEGIRGGLQRGRHSQQGETRDHHLQR